MTAKNHHKSNYKNLYDQNLNQLSEGILIKYLSFLSTARAIPKAPDSAK
jgi:hypothetical protein